MRFEHPQHASDKEASESPLFERIAQQENAIHDLLKDIDGSTEHRLNVAWEKIDESRGKTEQHIHRLAATETVIGTIVAGGLALLQQPELAVTAGLVTALLDVKAVLDHLRAEHGSGRAFQKIKSIRARGLH